MLFNTNLTPHLIQEEVIVQMDQEELSVIPVNSNKAEFVLRKIYSALETGITDSFYKILEIMKCYGNRDAKKLATDIELGISEMPGDEGTYVCTICFYDTHLHSDTKPFCIIKLLLFTLVCYVLYSTCVYTYIKNLGL